MRLNSKGYSLYELMICLVIVISLINYCLLYFGQLNQKIILNREEYKMKQLLIANLMLLEANQPLLDNSESYQFYYDEEKICIVWIDKNEINQNFCKTYLKPKGL